MRKYIIRVLVLVTLLYGGHKFFEHRTIEYRNLGQIIHSQKHEITQLEQGAKDLETIEALQLDLQKKLFGVESLKTVSSKKGSPLNIHDVSPILSSAILNEAKRQGIQLISFQDDGIETELQFTGKYRMVQWFLNQIETELPRLNVISIRKISNRKILLTIRVLK